MTMRALIWMSLWSAVAFIGTSTRLAAVPNASCVNECRSNLSLEAFNCARLSLRCGFLAPECAFACGVIAVYHYDSCVSGCGGGGGAGGTWLAATEAGAYTYNYRGILSLAAGRRVGDAFLTGQGTVTQASFYLLDLDSIPPDGFPPTTPLEAMPWLVSSGPGHLRR